MDQKLICQWLQLSSETWPPDHYHLLGIERDGLTLEEVERQVHERMEIVRRYQLAHPDEATEAMNRLAKAYVCLADPESRADYDALPPASRIEAALSDHGQRQSVLFARKEMQPGAGWDGTGPAPALLDVPVVILEADAARTDVGRQGSQTRLATVSGSDGRSLELHSLLPSPRDRAEYAETASSPAEHEEPPAARTGRDPAGRRRSPYRQLARLGKLLRAWQALEGPLGDPTARVNRATQAAALVAGLAELEGRSHALPGGFGHTGEAGSLVIALARQQVALATFQALLASQRESLAADWREGLGQLQRRRRALRRNLQATRQRRLVSRELRRAWLYLTDHPEWLLLALAVLALLIAVPRTLVGK